MTLYACGTSVELWPYAWTMDGDHLATRGRHGHLGLTDTLFIRFFLLTYSLLVHSSILQFSPPCFLNHACPESFLVAIVISYMSHAGIYLIVGGAAQTEDLCARFNMSYQVGLELEVVR